MHRYNLYWKNSKLNNKPLSLEDINNISSREYIYKINNISKEKEKIPVNQIRLVKCTIL